MPRRRAARANKPRQHQPPTIAAAVLRSRDAAVFCGLKSTQFSKHVKAGDLPPPIKLTDTGRAVGWLKTEWKIG